MSMNWTPMWEIAKQTGRLPGWTSDEWLGDDDETLRSPFLSFWIDFLVDSVPRSSFMTVDPRYFNEKVKIIWQILTEY